MSKCNNNRANICLKVMLVCVCFTAESFCLVSQWRETRKPLHHWDSGSGSEWQPANLHTERVWGVYSWVLQTRYTHNNLRHHRSILTSDRWVHALASIMSDRSCAWQVRQWCLCQLPMLMTQRQTTLFWGTPSLARRASQQMSSPRPCLSSTTRQEPSTHGTWAWTEW